MYVAFFNLLLYAYSDSCHRFILKEAVELYTINGAYSMRQDDRTGTLSVGKDADFIVIDQDIFLLEANSQGKKIAQTKVLTTVLEGEEIYKVRF